MGIIKPYRSALLDKLNPLSRGLIACWLFNENNGGIVFDHSGFGNHLTLNLSSVAWGDSGLYYTADDQQQCLLTNSINFGANHTIVCKVKPYFSASDAITNMICGAHDNDNYIAFSSGTTGREYVIQDNGNNNIIFSSSYAYTANDVFSWALSSDGANWRNYRNGVLEEAKGYTTYVIIEELFNGYTDNQYTWQGSIEYFYIYDRVLSQPEIMMVHLNPYQIFESESISRLVYVAAAGGSSENSYYYQANQ